MKTITEQIKSHELRGSILRDNLCNGVTFHDAVKSLCNLTQLGLLAPEMIDVSVNVIAELSFDAAVRRIARAMYNEENPAKAAPVVEDMIP